MTRADYSEIRQAWRAVAIAKPTEFHRQCWRLADLAREGLVDKQLAVDTLHEIVIAHNLDRLLGPDRVQQIMSEAFENCPAADIGAEAAA
jgi:hypothetical protein